MANTGFGKGLAVRHDFGKDIQTLYQRENMRAQVQEEKRRKAQLYGSMLKKGHVRGEYNTKRLEEHYDGLNNELSNFVTENPGWETDPGLFAKFAEISDGYLQNEIIQEDVQVQQQFESLQQKVNSGTMGVDEINRQMDMYSNYIENGGDPYVFVNPKDYDPMNLIAETANIVGTTQEEVFFKKNGVSASRMETRPNYTAIQPAVNALFADPDKRRSMEKMYADAGGKEVADSAKQYATELVEGTFKFADSQMHYDQYEMTMARVNATKTAAGQAPPVSQVYNHVYSHYEDAMMNRRDITVGELQPNGANATLTPWGKVGQVQNITSADNYQLINPETGKPMPFNYNVHAELKGVGSFATHNLNPYVESFVNIRIPRARFDSETEKDNPDENMINILKSSGFEIVEEEEFSIYNRGKMPTDEIILRGTMLAPASLNSMTFNAFDKSVLGQATTTDIGQSGLYGYMGEDAQIEAKIAGINKARPGFNFTRNADGNIYSLDGKYRLDPKTEDVYSVK